MLKCCVIVQDICATILTMPTVVLSLQEELNLSRIVLSHVQTIIVIVITNVLQHFLETTMTDLLAQVTVFPSGVVQRLDATRHNMGIILKQNVRIIANTALAIHLMQNIAATVHNIKEYVRVDVPCFVHTPNLLLVACHLRRI